MDVIVRREFPNLAEFLNYFEQEHKLTRSFLFRGQASGEWDLISSLDRCIKHASVLVDRPEHCVRSQAFSNHFVAFLRDVFPFVSDGTQSSIKEYRELLKGRRPDYVSIPFHNVTYFARHGFWPFGYVTSEDLDIFGSGDARDKLETLEAMLLGFAQHYGLPTPLLDWTHSLLYAWWFAAKDVAPDGGKPTVIACNIDDIINCIRIAIERHVFAEKDRIRSLIEDGEGWKDYFYKSNLWEMSKWMSLRRGTEYLRENEHLTMQRAEMTYIPPGFSLEQIIAGLEGVATEPLLFKFTINENPASKLLVDLSRLGIAGENLFPQPHGSSIQHAALMRMGGDSAQDCGFGPLSAGLGT